MTRAEQRAWTQHQRNQLMTLGSSSPGGAGLIAMALRLRDNDAARRTRVEGRGFDVLTGMGLMGTTASAAFAATADSGETAIPLGVAAVAGAALTVSAWLAGARRHDAAFADSLSPARRFSELPQFEVAFNRTPRAWEIFQGGPLELMAAVVEHHRYIGKQIFEPQAPAPESVPRFVPEPGLY